MCIRETTVINDFNKEVNDSLIFSLQFVRDSDITVIINPEGTIATENGAYFLDKIDLLITHGYYNVFIDMDSVQSVSAGGIGTLIRISEKVRKHGGCVILKHIPRIVLDIFQLPGFDRYFEMEEKKEFAHDCLDRRKFTEALKIWNSKHHEDIIRQ